MSARDGRLAAAAPGGALAYRTAIFAAVDGRVVAERATYGTAEALLLGTLAPGGGVTPRARWGDRLAWPCLAGTAAPKPTCRDRALGTA